MQSPKNEAGEFPCLFIVFTPLGAMVGTITILILSAAATLSFRELMVLDLGIGLAIGLVFALAAWSAEYSEKTVAKIFIDFFGASLAPLAIFLGQHTHGWPF